MGFFDVFPTFAEAPLAWVLLCSILPVSIAAFVHKPLYHALILHPYEIYRGKRVHTLFTSAFVHRSWFHLVFNLFFIFGMSYDFFGILEQEFENVSPITLSALFTLLVIVLPNALITFLRRDDVAYTAVGASGVSFGLFGFCFLYFPLEDMSGSPIPLDYSYQYWIAGFLLSVSLLFRKTTTNHAIHLCAFMLGTVVALALRPIAMSELIDLFRSS